MAPRRNTPAGRPGRRARPEPSLVPGFAEAEAARVWREHRLRALVRAAFVGKGYDPEAFDAALLTHRAARPWLAAARRG
jgi:hypothetical protein